jgi:hypothetical protein
VEIFQRLNTLAPGAVGAADLTPEELPFLRFEAEARSSSNRKRSSRTSFARPGVTR